MQQHKTQRYRFEVLEVTEERLAPFPREVAAFLRQRSQGDGPKQYVHLLCFAPQIEEAYVMHGVGDDVRLFWSGPFSTRTVYPYIHFHAQRGAEGARGTVWVLCDWIDDTVAVGFGQGEEHERIRLSDLVEEGRGVIFVCQVHIGGPESDGMRQPSPLSGDLREGGESVRLRKTTRTFLQKMERYEQTLRRFWDSAAWKACIIDHLCHTRAWHYDHQTLKVELLPAGTWIAPSDHSWSQNGSCIVTLTQVSAHARNMEAIGESRDFEDLLLSDEARARAVAQRLFARQQDDIKQATLRHFAWMRERGYLD
jgi:hypothetical protein